MGTIGEQMALGLRDMYPTVLTFVLIGIVLGIGLYVLQEFLGKLTSGTEAYNSTEETIAALGDFSGWFAIIIIVIAAAIIIGLVMRSFTEGR